MKINNFLIELSEVEFRIFKDTEFLKDIITVPKFNNFVDLKFNLFPFIPKLIEKDKIYFNVKSDITKSISSVDDLVTSLNLTYDWVNFKFTEGFKVEIELTNIQDNIVQANTIPFKGNVIKGTELAITNVIGEYNIDNNIFTGVIETDLISNIKENIKKNIENLNSFELDSTIYRNAKRINKDIYINDIKIPNIIDLGGVGDAEGVLLAVDNVKSAFLSNNVSDREEIITNLIDTNNEVILLSDAITTLATTPVVQGSPIAPSLASNMLQVKNKLNTIISNLEKLTKRLK